jgi:hypothetical protein
MTTVLATPISKYGTSAQWAASSVPLLLNEIGYDTDLKIEKRGDGTSLWGALPEMQARPIVLVSAAMDYNTSGNAYTIPQGTNIFVNTSNYVSGGITVTLPAAPENAQPFTLYVGPSEIQGLILNGNGNTIVGGTSVHVPMYGSITYQFLTGYGWIPQNNNPLWNNNSSATRVGRATQSGGGFRFGNSSTSTDWYLVNNTVWIQSSSGLPNLFWNGITADVTNVVGAYNNARGGLYATAANSHLGQGAGHTNDAQVELNLAVSQSSFSAANLFPSAPAGSGVWFTHKNAPIYVGRVTGYGYTGGYDEQYTMEGVHEFYKPLRLAPYTVASLEAAFPASAATLGMTAYVTDATSPTYLGTLTGGGAVNTPVFCNGTAWVSH